MPTIQTATYLARINPRKLTRQALYYTTKSKSQFITSIRHRLNLKNHDSKLLACLVRGDSHNARQLLDEMPQIGHQSKIVTWTSLLSNFTKSGFINEARLLFDAMPERNVVTCNAMLSGYVQSGRLSYAVGFFNAMEVKNVVSWTSMLNGLMKFGQVEEAKALFDEMPEKNVVTWNSMINGLVKNGDIEGARAVFDMMPIRYIVSWNVMINGYAENCMMEEAKALFDQMEVRNVITWTTMINGYCRDEDLCIAYDIFRSMPEKNVVSWTAMIGGYSWNGYYKEAIYLFLEMINQGDVKPNLETFVSLAYASGGVGLPRLCMQLHSHLITNYSENYDDYDHDGRISHGLIFMYTRCGLMEYAESIFMKDSTILTTQCCNTMISGYIQKGQLQKAENIFYDMTVRDTISWTSMITGYFNANKISQACKLFSYMPEKDVISWTSIISGYVQNELFSEAMKLFIEMQFEGLIPLQSTYSTLIGAAGASSDIDRARQLHCSLIKIYTNLDLIIQNSLISTYAKCGEITDAYRIFSKMTEVDCISFNSMIMGFSIHGLAKDALSLFNSMRKSSIIPDSVTFLGVLSACCHTGLIDEGWTIYKSMKEIYQINPDVEHNICMINLLGRAGKIEEAEKFVLGLDFNDDVAIWGALLGVCGINEGNTEIAGRISRRLLELDPVNAAGHVVMCNVHASVGLFREEGMLRKEMRVKGVRKSPGFSWVSSENGTQVFLSASDDPEFEIRRVEKFIGVGN